MKDSNPWYRQFWPWFVIALPLISVVASVSTLVIALRHADSLVRSDWYEGGQRINQELALDKAATDRGISAVLRVGDDGSVAVQLDAPDGSRPPELELELRHPTEAARDLHVKLRGEGQGRFEGHLQAAVADGAAPDLVGAGWYAQLQPMVADWRLTSRVSLPTQGARF